MPRYEVTLPDGRRFEVTSDHPLSDAEAYQHATGGRGGEAAAPEQPSALRRFLSPLLPSTTPADYINGPLYAMRHPLDSASLLGDAIAKDPVGAVPVVGRVKHGIEDAQHGDYAGAAGNTAGLLLDLFGLRKAAPEIVPDVVAPVARATARGAGTVADVTGRGMEAIGTSKPMQRVASLGAAGEALIKGDLVKAAVIGATPPALEYGGRGLQRLGARLKNLGATNDVAAPVTTGEHADQMASGASKYAAGKTAQTAQQNAAAGASGVSLDDIVEPTASVAPGPMSPRLVGKAPTLNDTLQQALESVKGGPGPATRTSDKLPDTPDARFQEPPAGPATHRFGPPNEATADDRMQALFGDEQPVREAPPTGDEATRFLDLFSNETPVRGAVPAAEPMAGDAGAEFHAVGEPTDPQATLEQAVSGINGNGNGSGPSYTDWASQIDDIVNQTTPHDLAQHPAQAGLRTAAWKNYLTKKAAAGPPIREVTDQYR